VAWLFLVAAVLAGGCGSMSGGLRPGVGLDTPGAAAIRPEPAAAAGPAAAVEPAPAPAAAARPAGADAAFPLDPADFRGVLVAATAGFRVPVDVLLAQAAAQPRDPADADLEDYDPWEPFNDRMFTVNRQIDRYALKPAAEAWAFVLPDRLIQMLDDAFRNLATGPRVANLLLQGRFRAASIETGRFLVNSTIGVAGLFDVARQEFGLPAQRADFGQTLGSWGTPTGPYLVLPLFPPSTVRDTVGTVVDGFLDPISYVVPFIWERLVLKVVDTINARALNLELYEGFEETTLDLYTAVRSAYLQRRAQMVREAIEQSAWNLRTKEELRR
jgi:phospholipid-binding lipoprotein MlaA